MILCVMRIPPDPNGHGGSQRAWFLLKALCLVAPLHFVLVSRKLDPDAASTSLEQLRPFVESVTHIDIPEWQPFDRMRLPVWARKLHTGWFDAARMHSQEAPRLSKKSLATIARQLPIHKVQVVFAGRLPSAVIVDQLIESGHLSVRRKVVDFDDVMSVFRWRQLKHEVRGVQSRFLARLDARRIEAAERRVAESWSTVSVCSDHDVKLLRRRYPATEVIKAPNVIDRPQLPIREGGGPTRVLFVGNLSFSPNVQGLLAFLNGGWPEVARVAPAVRLTVAGLNPRPEVVEACVKAGVELRPNVSDLEALYAESDLVVAPVLFGSGTRIKILEAMAYGRPVVSTTAGAEGLDIVSGEHALLADDMRSFGEAVVRLAADASLRCRLTAAARALQERRFGFAALAAAVLRMVEGPAA